jgi:hypothetical protein
MNTITEVRTYQKLTKDDSTNGVMNVRGISKLINNLILENDPSNDELIEFYRNKIAQVYSN